MSPQACSKGIPESQSCFNVWTWSHSIPVDRSHLLAQWTSYAKLLSDVTSTMDEASPTGHKWYARISMQFCKLSSVDSLKCLFTLVHRPTVSWIRPSYTQKVSECIVIVRFDVHRMTDISRSQLISACKTLHIKIGEEKSKSAITRLVAKAMMDQHGSSEDGAPGHRFGGWHHQPEWTSKGKDLLNRFIAKQLITKLITKFDCYFSVELYC